MPNNVFAGVPIAVIAIQTASFSSIGLNSSNITVIHRIGNPPQSWIPTRGINPISGFVDGDGYIIYATQNLDLTAYVVPPLPSELEEIENWVIANFALINHTHPVTDITAAGGTEGQVIKIVSGVPTWASGGDQLLNSVTKSALDDLIDDDDLVAGRFYNITDRNIILQAVSTNSFAKVGTRKMLCPANYKIETDTYGNVWKGVWHPALTVATNSLVIYGGSIWKNITGSVGNNNDGDVTSLDATNWGLLSKTSFTNHQYVEKVFGVYYDVENDWVEKQWDNAGNEFGLDYATSQALGYTYNLCDISDWNYGSSDLLFSGNRCFGIFNNVLTGNITDNTNKGIISGNKTVDILKNSNAGDIVYNTVISGIKKNSNTGSLTNASGNIGYNLGQYEISYNNNNGTIELNEVSDPTVSFIINNSNNGNIVSNTNTGNISYNANAGSITGNSNIGVIDGNHCGQDIYNNSNNGDIQYNFNIYGIGENSNNGRIYGNSNLGTINDNTNDGEIYYNNNEDEITDNSNEGDIEFNSNNGKIINNSNKGDIEYNIVLGDIIDCSSGTDDCNIENNISDSSITGVFSDNVSKNTFTRNIDFDSHTVGIGNFAVGPYLVFNTSDVLDVFASTLNLNVATGPTTGLYIQNISNLATQDMLLGQVSTGPTLGRVGQIIVGAGLSLSSGTLASTSAAASSGTFTPTLTNVTNIASSTAYAGQYIRVGNVVTVSGTLSFQCTSAAVTGTEIGLTLPVASNFSSSIQLSGSAGITDASIAAGIEADPTNDRARIYFKSADTVSSLMHFTFTYQVI